MTRCYETDEFGNTFEWERSESKCPKCGAACIYDKGIGHIPDRIICESCGYKKGFEYKKINRVEHLDLH